MADHEHDINGRCIPQPHHTELAETLTTITAAVAYVSDGAIMEFPLALNIWSEQLFADMQAMQRELVIEGDILRAFLLPMTTLKFGFYTGYRAAQGGQEIPNPELISAM